VLLAGVKAAARKHLKRTDCRKQLPRTSLHRSGLAVEARACRYARVIATHGRSTRVLTCFCYELRTWAGGASHHVGVRPRSHGFLTRRAPVPGRVRHGGRAQGHHRGTPDPHAGVKRSVLQGGSPVFCLVSSLAAVLRSVSAVGTASCWPWRRKACPSCRIRARSARLSCSTSTFAWPLPVRAVAAVEKSGALVTNIARLPHLSARFTRPVGRRAHPGEQGARAVPEPPPDRGGPGQRRVHHSLHCRRPAG